MEIETTEDLANTIADWIGIYGCCKHMEKDSDCNDVCNETDPFCCRVGFMMEMPDRIRKAVENENKLKNIF